MIPIVCSFNEDYLLPASVFLTSLSESANEGTLYDITVLYTANRLNKESISTIKDLVHNSANLRISFLDVGEMFSKVYVSKHISIDAYFRLAIPVLFKHHKRILYLDVDIVVCKDLRGLFYSDLDNNLIGGVKDILTHKQVEYQKKIGGDVDGYINSGVLLFDVELINHNIDYKEKMESHIAQDYVNHDQDIINLIFKRKIEYLPIEFNYTFQYLQHGTLCDDPSIIHYTIFKPWNNLCAYSEKWWQFYSMSPIFSKEYYNKYQLEHYSDLNRHLRFGQLFKTIGIYSIMNMFRTK